MNLDQVKKFIPFARKLSIFQGLNASEIQLLLQICEYKEHDSGQFIYKTGDPATDMFILVKGNLSVLSPEGTELADISEGMTIGEMGLFTGQPRSADIVAKGSVSGLSFQKISLNKTLLDHKDIFLKVQQNVIGMLSDRLRKANSLLDRFGDTIDRMMDKVEELVGEPSRSDEPDDNGS